MAEKIKCPHCEEKIAEDSKYCRFCGGRVKKKKHKDQDDLEGQGRKVKKLQDRIQYLQDQLEDAGVKYKRADSDDDDDDDDE